MHEMVLAPMNGSRDLGVTSLMIHDTAILRVLSKLANTVYTSRSPGWHQVLPRCYNAYHGMSQDHRRNNFHHSLSQKTVKERSHVVCGRREDLVARISFCQRRLLYI
jgi:hypothetical protein